MSEGRRGAGKPSQSPLCTPLRTHKDTIRGGTKEVSGGKGGEASLVNMDRQGWRDWRTWNNEFGLLGSVLHTLEDVEHSAGGLHCLVLEQHLLVRRSWVDPAGHFDDGSN